MRTDTIFPVPVLRFPHLSEAASAYKLWYSQSSVNDNGQNAADHGPEGKFHKDAVDTLEGNEDHDFDHFNDYEEEEEEEGDGEQEGPRGEGMAVRGKAGHD